MKAKEYRLTCTRNEMLVDPDGRRTVLAIGGESRCILMPVYSCPDGEDDLVYSL